MKRGYRLAVVVLSIAGGPACAGDRPEAAAPTAIVGDQARAHFERGVKAMEAGAERYDEALAAFRAALAIEPTLWEAHLDIGIVELRRANLSAAARALEASVEVFPSPEALEALGEVYMRQGRSSKAVGLYEQALARNPDEPTLRTRLADALRHAGRLGDAEAELRAVLGRDAGNLEAYAQLAAIWLARGDLDLAELVLNKGLVHHPDAPALLTNLGLVALQRGDDQAAFQLFEKASTLDPQFLTGRLNRAAVYLGAGDHTRASEELQFILKVEPGNTRALMGLGLAKRLGGDLQGARDSWEHLLRLDPENADVHYNLAVLDMDFADKPAQAQAHLQKFLDLAPSDHPKRAEAKDRMALIKAIEQAG
jgi:tetratricopeptide (TPR) repeat protein